MAIAKFDDGLTDNPKLIAAGATACWLWFCGVMYCRRGLTDGFIPKAVLPKLVVGLASPFKHAARLIECGLWEEVVGGYQVHDFLDWNPSKTRIEDLRRKDRDRKHGSLETSSERKTTIPDTSSDRLGAHTVRGREDREGEGEREGVGSSLEEVAALLPPAWRQPGSRPAALIRTHQGCHEATRAACGRGSCVPPFIVAEWLQACESANLDAHVAIAATVTAALASVPDGRVFAPSDPPRYWRGWWSSTHGAAPTAEPVGRETNTGHTLRSAREYLEGR